MLQVGAEAFLLESSPQNVLMHGVGVLTPLRKLKGLSVKVHHPELRIAASSIVKSYLISIQRKLLLKLGDIFRVLVEQDRTIASLEA
jgi:hypothetical protein